MATNGPKGAPQLAPHRFTSESASAAGKKGVEVRRAKKLAQARHGSELAQRVRQLREALDGMDLAESVGLLLNVSLARAIAGEIPVRHAGDLAELVRALHEVLRLEAGQPTTIRGEIRVEAGQALKRLATLQASARAALDVVEGSATVPAADDVEQIPDVDVEPVEVAEEIPPLDAGEEGDQAEPESGSLPPAGTPTPAPPVWPPSSP